MLNKKSDSEVINLVTSIANAALAKSTHFKAQCEQENLLEEAINESINGELLGYLKEAITTNSPSIKNLYAKKFCDLLMSDVKEYINR